jgi:hypothetical protein
MVDENRLKISRKGHHTMALDQSALLDLLAQLKLTDVTDRIPEPTSPEVDLSKVRRLPSDSPCEVTTCNR